MPVMVIRLTPVAECGVPGGASKRPKPTLIADRQQPGQRIITRVPPPHRGSRHAQRPSQRPPAHQTSPTAGHPRAKPDDRRNMSDKREDREGDREVSPVPQYVANPRAQKVNSRETGVNRLDP